MRIDYDAGLVEDAMLVAVRGRPEARAMQREREALYRAADPEAREAAFREHARRWFELLDLAAPIRAALAERPLIAERAAALAVAPARGAKEEAAELYVDARAGDRPEARRVRLRLRPATFAEPARLLALLRHELLHVADMLDEAFGYRPDLATTGAGSMLDRLVQDRYRALWDATIDGRLLREGRVGPPVRAARLADFSGAFPMIAGASEAVFAEFFDGPRPPHARLEAVAADPWAAVAAVAALRPRSEECPLCRFPTAALERDLAEEVAARVQADFPAWQAERGACPQCAELYRAAPLSRREAARLPLCAETR